MGSIIVAVKSRHTVDASKGCVTTVSMRVKLFLRLHVAAALVISVSIGYICSDGFSHTSHWKETMFKTTGVR